MYWKKLFYLVSMATIVWLASVVLPESGVAVSTDMELQPLQLIGSAGVASEPDAMVFRCEGYHCNTYSELVYWGTDNKIYFLDSNSLAATGSPLSTTFNSLPGTRYLFHDRQNNQLYALLKTTEGYYPDSWQRLDVGIIRDYSYAGSVPVNQKSNTPTPVDNYYSIDGAALQNTGSLARIYIDNPVNGTVDIVSFDGNNPDTTALTNRISYRSPLGCASQKTCSWHLNSGSSLAVDKYGAVYIADNNDFVDRIVVRKPDGSAKPSIDNVADLFPCWVDEAGLHMAPEKNILYLPSGCQSFADGAVAQLDLAGGNHKVINLPYLDQGMIVDWSDQKRAFIATYDAFGDYDSESRLHLHLLYDGELVFSLPVMSHYPRRSLSAMAFDPNANVLYLAVEQAVYMVKVNYPTPQLPQVSPIIAPISILLKNNLND